MNAAHGANHFQKSDETRVPIRFLLVVFGQVRTRRTDDGENQDDPHRFREHREVETGGETSRMRVPQCIHKHTRIQREDKANRPARVPVSLVESKADRDPLCRSARLRHRGKKSRASAIIEPAFTQNEEAE